MAQDLQTASSVRIGGNSAAVDEA